MAGEKNDAVATQSMIVGAGLGGAAIIHCAGAYNLFLGNILSRPRVRRATKAI
jgi:hypothetical protein